LNALLWLAGIPLVLLLLGLLPGAARWLPKTAAALLVGQLGVAGWVCLPVLRGQPVSWGVFAADGIGAAFVIITTLVVVIALAHAAWLLPAEQAQHPTGNPRHLVLFYPLTGLFLLAMYAVVLAQHLGYLWIAMEATTLVSAPLVYYHRTRAALEAAWKYFILCSVGIAFALLGTILLLAAQQATGHAGSLEVSYLLAHASTFDPNLLRLAFLFCILGYGTKAGIFPLHNWLPDAHSEAPAPASAMLSGALLNCALVAIWRVSAVVSAAGQADLVHRILVPAGALTVLAASLLLVRQRDIKRLLAYSSVEHVGLLTMAIGLGAGPLFILHAFNHSLLKAGLFVLAGALLFAFGTKTLSRIKGIILVYPWWGGLFGAAIFGIAGSPPFGTFLSEWLLLSRAVAAGDFLAAVAVIVGLTITFVAILSQLGGTLFGAAPPVPALGMRSPWTWAVLGALLFSLLSGVALAPPVIAALTHLTGGGR
jgi:hydrogenase-4 component F